MTNARAWLFGVASNTLANRLRVARDMVEVLDDLAAPVVDLDRVFCRSLVPRAAMLLGVGAD